MDINYFYMGNEVAKTGTGKVATILFNTKQSFNESILEITDNSELVDEDDVSADSDLWLSNSKFKLVK